MQIWRGLLIFIKFYNFYRESINFAILYLHEKGELKRLENKWWYDRGQCDQGMSMSPVSIIILLEEQ